MSILDHIVLRDRLQKTWLSIGLGLFSVAAGGMTFGSFGGAAIGRYILIGLCAASGGIAAYIYLSPRFRHGSSVRFQSVFRDEPAECVFTDGDWNCVWGNRKAEIYFGKMAGRSIHNLFSQCFAAPDVLLQSLKDTAKADGVAVQDVARHADRYRVTLRPLMGQDLWLWRLEAGVAGRRAQQRATTFTICAASQLIIQMSAEARVLVANKCVRLDDLVKDLPLRGNGIHRVRTISGEKTYLIQKEKIDEAQYELVLNAVSLKEFTTAQPQLDALPVPLLKLSADGRILQANSEAARLLNVRHDRLGVLSEYMEGLGRPIADWIAKAAEGAGLNRSEFLRLTRLDQEMFVQVTLSRMVENGAPFLIAVLNDATELKTLEAQFVQSQKMQAIGQLAGGVAHDFNNLLTAISGHCDLMLLRHDQGDPDYGDLVQINQNANRAAALVGQLLAFSRKQTMRAEVLDMRDTLADLTHLLNRLVGEKVTLTLRHASVLPSIRGDRRQLEQVMMNLVVNARDAMRSGGEIIIETEQLVLSETMERDRAHIDPGVYVCVQVRDQGVGIPKDKLQKVFEPFYTTKRTGEGTGLGLSTVYGIVKQSSGYIFVDSEVGGGTVFTLIFPGYETEPDVLAIDAEPEKRRLPEKGSGVVLLVEDEAPVRAFAARALRLRGYTVIEAETAEHALALLEDPGLKIDVFVTDVVMPGMDGPSWVRKARIDRPNVRVVFVSGYAEDVFNEGQEPVPNSTFLPKPFSLSELTKTVHAQFM